MPGRVVSLDETFATMIAVALEVAKAAAFAATTLASCPTRRAAATAVEAACSESNAVFVSERNVWIIFICKWALLCKVYL